MPGSYPQGKDEIIEYIINNNESSTFILDVGPGYGTYGGRLNQIYKIDCVEIFERYISDYSLTNIYNEVHIGDICEFDYSKYDLIIMGDVLEHINTDKAIELIKNMSDSGKKLVVAVPYEYPQGEWGGNIHESHLQPDLTPTIMNERYPNLELKFNFGVYGYYNNF